MFALLFAVLPQVLCAGSLGGGSYFSSSASLPLTSNRLIKSAIFTLIAITTLFANEEQTSW